MIEQIKQALDKAESGGYHIGNVADEWLRYLIGEVERLKDQIIDVCREKEILRRKNAELQKALVWIAQYEQPKGYEDWILYQSLIRNTANKAIQGGDNT